MEAIVGWSKSGRLVLATFYVYNYVGISSEEEAFTCITFELKFDLDRKN